MSRFSIIIPVYNVEPYLEECLLSLTGQVFSNWEAVCIDDGSTDRSGAILDVFAAKDKRIHVVHQPNKGPSATRNVGLDAAQGDYIILLDGDDTLTPNALEILDAAINDEDMVCFGGQRYFEETGEYEEPDKIEVEENVAGWDYYCRHALEKRRFAFVSQSLRCYGHSFLEKNHLRFIETLRHEDNVFTTQAFLYAEKIKSISDIIYIYRIRGGSFMTSNDRDRREQLIRVANYMADFFSAQKKIEHGTIYRIITQNYQISFTRAARCEDRQLRALVDWRLYHIVSRTRLRHRLNYMAIRVSPPFFRWINSLM